MMSGTWIPCRTCCWTVVCYSKHFKLVKPVKQLRRSNYCFFFFFKDNLFETKVISKQRCVSLHVCLQTLYLRGYQDGSGVQPRPDPCVPGPGRSVRPGRAGHTVSGCGWQVDPCYSQRAPEVISEHLPQHHHAAYTLRPVLLNANALWKGEKGKLDETSDMAESIHIIFSIWSMTAFQGSLSLRIDSKEKRCSGSDLDDSVLI